MSTRQGVSRAPKNGMGLIGSLKFIVRKTIYKLLNRTR